MKITVKIKSVYGNEMIYPVCDKAKIFARMLNQKTLTMNDIQKIKELGFFIDVDHNCVAVGTCHQVSEL